MLKGVESRGVLGTTGVNFREPREEGAGFLSPIGFLFHHTTSRKETISSSVSKKCVYCESRFNLSLNQ